MADATLTQSPRNIGMLQTAKFTVAADNDVLLASGNYLIVAMEVTGSVTGFSVGANNYTYHTAATDTYVLPAVVSASAVVANGTGAGTITLYYFVLPTVTEGVAG